ncbi:MAG: hypothetical protein A2Z37_07190 [Chloroflexi bacterium RBG_19FT_COMBO_62_14]|nr:MAG: hypothetical protein A2Z37_07190 [Chloroflexi bacterium RBG_19FT_COMBO_62_14]
MEELTALIAVLTGLVVRFGIPLGLTALAAWGLRRLDAHWQAEGETLRQRAHSLGAAGHQVRCWEIRDCPAEERESCLAYGRADVPCWQVFRETGGRLPEPCLTCHVFRDVPAPIAA